MSCRPNVLWVTLESTRFDHTSLSGYERDTTPTLARVAGRATARSFDRCFSPGIWTRSVSGSILTGTYPSHHGAGMTRKRIPDSLATVPELLGELGYRTVGVSPNANLSPATGLDRGFDDFVWIEKSELVENVGLSTVLKFLANIRRHGGGISTDTRKHNTGYMMTDVATRWLERHGGEDPFFMYLHYGDPHHPYYPPLGRLRREAERLSVDPRMAGQLVLDHHTNLNERVAEGLPYSDQEWETLLGLYDASIEYADSLVSRVLEAAESGPRETIVVVTADHGELFGEYGLLGHKVTVHDALAHVPMVVDGLDGALADDSGLVQHIDVMGTVLDEVGADTGQFQGVRLGHERRGRALVQRGWDRCQRHLDTYGGPDGALDTDRFPEGDLTAVRTRKFKYIKGESETTLYRPPDEETDVSERYPAVIEELDTVLTAWLESTGTPVDEAGVDAELSPKARNQLSELGYFID
jgi:uncharacterized sulfatase